MSGIRLPTCGNRVIVFAVVAWAAFWTCAASAEEASPGLQLLAAVREGDLPEVRRLVEEGAYKPTTIGGITALAVAKSEGHTEIAELLRAKLDEYVESGEAGEAFANGFKDGLRKRAARDPDNPINRRLLDRLDALDGLAPVREVGDRFRDCRSCPEMIVLPSGEFEMGSPSSEDGRHDWEGPVHRVDIAQPVAMGLQEVTVGEFRRFVADTGHAMGDSCWTFVSTKSFSEEFDEILSTDFGDKATQLLHVLRGIGGRDREGQGWRNPGYRQGDTHPVVCASWEDARAYAKWLSDKTGQSYRLPSEAEWEYAARAGTDKARYWGDGEACRFANSAEPLLSALSRSTNSANQADEEQCPDGHTYSSSAGSYLPNSYGLYDMLGNVWEWTADCFNNSYVGAPRDGSAWEQGDCSWRMRRGGSYQGVLSPPRSALRSFLPEGDRTADMGFRVVRPVAREMQRNVTRTDRDHLPAMGLGIGEHFRDCAECPQMVVVPKGSFEMGSRRGEKGRNRNEGPVHDVSIGGRFAIGVYEVTGAEFGRFVADTGHQTEDECLFFFLGNRVKLKGGWQTRPDGHPVGCVSWHDARAYVRWLSAKTGERYRLPGEAEWEYSARGGSTASKYWLSGDAKSGRPQWAGQCAHGNGADRSLSDWLVSLAETPQAAEYARSTASSWARCEDWHQETAPVGSYRPNDFGLHDVIGNVAEWTEDCWNRNYRRAPKDGQAWTAGDCQVRVVRGGSFMGEPRELRSAYRHAVTVDDRFVTVGFRVARALDSVAVSGRSASSD